MITSPGNAKVKNVIALAKKPKARREQGLFVAEGHKMFLEAPADWIREVYVSEDFHEMDLCREKLAGIRYETVSHDVFEKMSDTVTPQGILCVLTIPVYRSFTDNSKGEPLLLILEDIKDPGNLGTLFRTAEGAGVSGIIMSRDTVDVFNPKTIRSTMGSIYRMPFLYTDNLVMAIENLKEKNIKVYAAHLSESVAYTALDYRTAGAFLIGNEAAGLRKETADLADNYIRIPMAGKVESLNAAVAGAILMYEAARQRAL